jgi:hypothetical protein
MINVQCAHMDCTKEDIQTCKIANQIAKMTFKMLLLQAYLCFVDLQLLLCARTMLLRAAI